MPVIKKSKEINVTPIGYGHATFHLLGISPFVFNALPQKTWRELLYPGGKLSAGGRKHTLKHNPIEEFRNSVYRNPLNNAPTRLQFLAGAFKSALAKAALDMPGDAKKAEIGRLVWVPQEWAPVWGIPKLDMKIVRQSGINRTPDVRTRALLERWAAKVTMKWMQPNLSIDTISTLLQGSGIICGVGDGRQEKGKLSNGQFEIVNEDDPRLIELTTTAGREAQDAALADPEPSDTMTAELLQWFAEEFERRRGEPAVEEYDEEGIPDSTGNGLDDELQHPSV